MLCTPVEENRLASVLFHFRKDLKMANCQLNERAMKNGFGWEEIAKKHPIMKGLLKKRYNIKFKANLQAALWRTSVFQKLIDPSENPWQFEAQGSKRAGGLEIKTGAGFWMCQHPSPLNYLNAIVGGKLKETVVSWMKSHQVPLPDYNFFLIKRGLNHSHAL